MSDAFGDRLRMFDKSGTTSLELLRFRPDLVAVHGFEKALRDRVALLRTFRNPAFAPAWAVEKLEGDRLGLVSTFADGKRLAEIVASPRERARVNPLFASWLVCDLTAALAALQRHHNGIAHGALTADRIVITPDGRLMIVEHVLGAALDRLKRAPSRLGEEFGLVSTGGGDGVARLDQRSDVIQLGWIVLSVLVGRRLTAADYPQRVDELLDEFVRSGPRPQALVTALRSWLERALQVSGAGFGSAVEANDVVFDLRVHGGPQADAYSARRARASLARTVTQPHSPTEPVPAEPLLAESVADEPVPTEPVPAEPLLAQLVPEEPVLTEPVPAEPLLAESVPDEPVLTEPVPAEPLLAQSVPEEPQFTEPVPATPEPAEVRLVDARSEPAPTEEIATTTAGSDVIAELRAGLCQKEIPAVAAHAERETMPRRRLGWVTALALVAAAEGVALSWLYVARAAPATGNEPIVLESLTPGDPVLVNGWQAGLTPLTLTLTPDVRSIRVQARGPQPPIDASNITVPREVVRPVVVPEAKEQAVAVAPERRGGLRVDSSPVVVQVLAGDRVIGSAAGGPIMMTAGRHEFDLINTAVGYRSRNVVDIVAGQTVRVNIAIPDGRLSVNAIPWAQILIDGDPVGETPLANLPLPVGEHQVTFRHPQLGEQTQRVTVKADALTRVSATLSR